MTPKEARNIELPINPFTRSKVVREILDDPTGDLFPTVEVHPTSEMHTEGFDESVLGEGKVVVYKVLPFYTRNTLIQAAKLVDKIRQEQ